MFKKFFSLLITLIFSLTLVTTANAKETRCGWLENPTPANWWLTDAEGSWTLSAQGGYTLDDESFSKIPDMGKNYVEVNGSYGYGCACLSLEVDKANSHVTKVFGGKALPLKKCRADKKLPPEPK